MCCGLEKQSQVQLKIVVRGWLRATLGMSRGGHNRCERLEVEKCVTTFRCVTTYGEIHGGRGRERAGL